MYDIIIIGGGPAGVTAAVYAARAGFCAVIFEKVFIGGQVVNAAEVENYPAHGRISGVDLAQKFAEHLALFDIPVILSEVKSVIKDDDSAFTVEAGGKQYRARAVIAATGAVPKKLGITGEGLPGVSYCAMCDGSFYKNKTVCVIGGGNTAVHDAVFLSNICEKVYIIHRRAEFRADSGAVKKMLALPNIEPVLSAAAAEITGEDMVTGIKLTQNNTPREIITNAVFIAIGTNPAADFITGIKKDETGAIITDEHMATNIPGIFAAGDVRKTALKQITTACANGAAAAVSAGNYISVNCLSVTKGL